MAILQRGDLASGKIYSALYFHGGNIVAPTLGAPQRDIYPWRLLRNSKMFRCSKYLPVGRYVSSYAGTSGSDDYLVQLLTLRFSRWIGRALLSLLHARTTCRKSRSLIVDASHGTGVYIKVGRGFAMTTLKTSRILRLKFQISHG